MNILHFTCKKLQHRVSRMCEVTIECRILGLDVTEQEIPVVFELCNMQYYTFVSTNWYSNTKIEPRLDQFSLIEHSPMNALIALLESTYVCGIKPSLKSARSTLPLCRKNKLSNDKQFWSNSMP